MIINKIFDFFSIVFNNYKFQKLFYYQIIFLELLVEGRAIAMLANCIYYVTIIGFKKNSIDFFSRNFILKICLSGESKFIHFIICRKAYFNLNFVALTILIFDMLDRSQAFYWAFNLYRYFCTKSFGFFHGMSCQNYGRSFSFSGYSCNNIPHKSPSLWIHT